MNDAMQGMGKLVPGFDFLQGLVQSANSAMPNFTQWVAPTLDPKELEKRISELRTVQFWLEQNAKMIGATIQAMEVQRMTLNTLQTMNVSMDTLRESMQLNPAQMAGMMGSATAPPAASAPSAASPEGEDAAEAPAAAGVVDPMQWWGALTQQFAALAGSTMAEAMNEKAAESARNMAGDMMKQGFAAAESMRQALSSGQAAFTPPADAAAGGTPGAAGAAKGASAARGRGGKTGAGSGPDASAGEAGAGKTAGTSRAKPKPKA